MAQINYSQDLVNTLIQCPHINEVHFTASGEHFFQVHQHNGKKYGRLKLEPVKSHTQGDRQFFKNTSVHTAEAEIVKTVKAKDIIETGATALLPNDAGVTAWLPNTAGTDALKKAAEEALEQQIAAEAALEAEKEAREAAEAKAQELAKELEELRKEKKK